VDEDFVLVFGFLFLGGELDFVLVGESGELVLQGFDLVFEQGRFFGVAALLLLHLVLNLLHNFLFAVLEFLPFFEYFFLQTFLFHFVVVFELDDGKLDVAFLLLKVFGVLLVEDEDLSVVVLLLELNLLFELLCFGFVGFGEFVQFVHEFLVFFSKGLVGGLDCPEFVLQLICIFLV
jgi:hypothetical protein